MTLLKVLVAWCAAIALVAGCGGGSGGAGGRPTASPTPNEAAAFLAVARCMRAHGYPNFPDPIQDPESGRWGWPESGVPRRTNSTACDPLVRQAKSLGRRKDSEKVSAADMVKLRAYARCLRQQGVSDWPDPDSTGAFSLPARLSGENGMNLVRTQDRACKKYVPSNGKIRITQSGSGGN
jgi:hypothetical protein